jgi:hypothetical protein
MGGAADDKRRLEVRRLGLRAARAASAKLTPEEQSKLQELKTQSEQQLDLHRQGREVVASAEELY